MSKSIVSGFVQTDRDRLTDICTGEETGTDIEGETKRPGETGGGEGGREGEVCARDQDTDNASIFVFFIRAWLAADLRLVRSRRLRHPQVGHPS